MTPRGVLAFCREKEVKAIDLRFADLLGRWQRITIPVNRLSESSFEQGYPLDSTQSSSTIDGYRLVIPHAASAFLDPFASIPTLVLIGTLQDPITREDDPLDARIIAERAVSYLRETRIADQAKIAISCEFYLFDHVHLSLDSWTSEVALTPAIDSSFDFRNAVMEMLANVDIPVIKHFQTEPHGSQAAIELDKLDLVLAADAMLKTKWIVHRFAKQQNRVATFLPKPLRDQRGSGMPVQLSLWKGEEPLFGGQGYGGLSDLAMLSLGGVLHHAAALTALCNPITNAYRRLHYSDQPSLGIGYSQRSQRTVCSVPMVTNDPRAKCIEIATPDASTNPYLAFAALLMAAIDGIQNKLEPGPPASSESDKGSSMASLPRSLWDALDRLEEDTEFLTRGDVFTPEMLHRWIEHQRTVERPAIESQPTPAEFSRYFDC